MRNILVYFAILFLLISCNGSYEKNNSQLKVVIRNHFKEKSISFDKEIKNCVIIPGGGCSGCIASGISFLKSHKDKFSKNQKNNIVIFTNIFSLKKLKRQLGDITLNELNCVVDTSNVYLIHCKENIYPILLMFDKSKMKDVKVQSPKEDGLYEINL